MNKIFKELLLFGFFILLLGGLFFITKYYPKVISGIILTVAFGIFYMLFRDFFNFILTDIRKKFKR